MTSVLPSKLTFEQFLENRSADGRYELIDGGIVRILATRRHEDVADFIQDCFNAQIRQSQLNYKVSGRIVLATFKADGAEQGRHPDVSVIDLESVAFQSSGLQGPTRTDSACS